ncbi:MAG: superoxide dismutase [Peptostreptococcaceae bacterium]
MNRKYFIIIFISVFVISSYLNSFALEQTFKPFEEKKLNYNYESLEPYIDKETMILHHDKHYKSYLDKLNNALKDYPELYSYSLYDLLRNLDSIPKDVAQIIKNNGGGVYNHEFFFDMMTSKKTQPSGDLYSALIRDFGSFDNFKDEFKRAAMSVFGSGWAWLVSDNSGKLSIMTTPNQDSPVTLNLKPIIGLDVWEHAYYLLYQNNRSNYINNWFNIINWDNALKNYTEPLN